MTSTTSSATTTVANTNSLKVRYCYLRDPKNPKRVMTIGRVLSGNTVSWTYCISNPKDLFIKKTSRTIIEGRIKKAKTRTMELAKDRRTIEHIVSELADSSEDILAARIARAHVDSFKTFVAFA